MESDNYGCSHEENSALLINIAKLKGRLRKRDEGLLELVEDVEQLTCLTLRQR